MNRMTIDTSISGDGVLHLEIPIGPCEANRAVRVTVDPVPNFESVIPEDWAAWVDTMAGSWKGEYPESAIEDYEAREPLS